MYTGLAATPNRKNGSRARFLGADMAFALLHS